MKFIEQLDHFMGTGEKNAAGETLEEFLEHYDARKYDCPSNTVDMLILRSDGPYRSFEQKLRLLMIRRSNHPSIGFWALPGGFVDLREDLKDAAARELREETGVTDVPLIQLSTYGAFDRDPRWRVITTAYMALIEKNIPVRAGDDAADALWMDVSLKEETVSGTVTENSSCDKGYQPERSVCSSSAPSEKIWSLTLENKSAGISLSTRAKEIVIPRGILKDRSLHQLETHGIAADHGLMIIDALLYLKNILSA